MFLRTNKKKNQDNNQYNQSVQKYNDISIEEKQGEIDNNNNNNKDGEEELENTLMNKNNNATIELSNNGTTSDDMSAKSSLSGSQPNNGENNVVWVMDESQPGYEPTPIPFDKRRVGPEIIHDYAEFAYCRGCGERFTRAANASGATYFRCEGCRSANNIIEGSCIIL